MIRMLVLISMFGCGGKAAQAPANVGRNDGPQPLVTSTTDVCAAQKTCVSCLSSATDDPNRGSCDWDIDKQTCQVSCGAEAKNCLLVGAKNIGEQRASEVCNGARQPQP